MERKVSKVEAHLEEQADSVIFSVSLVEQEDRKNQVPEKPNQSLLKFKSLSIKFTMVVWKTLKLRDIETAKIAMVKEVKTFKNVQNVKVKVQFKNLSNSVQVCIHNHPKDVAIVKVREK